MQQGISTESFSGGFHPPMRFVDEGPMRVFIADRSVEFCQRLEHMLSELDCVQIITNTQDPLAALQGICELRPDVVILDIHMFGGNGLDLMKRVKREKWASFIMVLASETSDQYRRKCARAGADCLLYKPNAQQNAKRILQSLINQSIAARE
jgi:DNA-binding NarL/FixJ family response regulator